MAVLLNIILAPLVEVIASDPTFPLVSIFIQLSFTLLLVILVFTVGHNKLLIGAYTILALVALVFTWINLDSIDTLMYRNLFTIAALTIAMVLLLVEVFKYDCVTIDTISGALCAYLLLGLTFATVYAFIDIVQPGSFLSTASSEPITLTSELDRIYFSYITLLTVGYGDIVPLSHFAKLSAVIEGFLGQVYLVVMIARLVGMHVSQRANHSQ